MTLKLEEILAHNELVDKNRSAQKGAKIKNCPNFFIKTQGCDARGADFSKFPFVPSDLRGADLREADLRGTSLNFVFLEGADLRGAKVDDSTFCFGYTGQDAIEKCLAVNKAPDPPGINAAPMPIRSAGEVDEEELAVNVETIR